MVIPLYTFWGHTQAETVPAGCWGRGGKGQDLRPVPALPFQTATCSAIMPPVAPRGLCVLFGKRLWQELSREV